MFRRKRKKFQCFEELDKNANVWQDKTSILLNVWKQNIRILMFGKIRKEFQCLEGWDKNSNVWKDGKNSNVFKDNSRNQMYRRIKKVQCPER